MAGVKIDTRHLFEKLCALPVHGQAFGDAVAALCVPVLKVGGKQRLVDITKTEVASIAVVFKIGVPIDI